MSWYKTGTVKVTSGSRTVTGTGTSWIDGNVRPGFAFVINNGIYEVDSIVSATELRLAKNYGGTSASGQQYSILPNNGGLVEIANNVTQLVGQYSNYAAEVVDVIADGEASIADTLSSAALKANNLSDLANKSTARDNLGVTILVKDSLRDAVEAASGGARTVLYTPKGQPTHMNIIPAFNCEDVDPTGELGTGLHPAFIFNGKEDSEIFIGSFPAAWISSEVVCQPGLNPLTSIDFDTSRSRCQALGQGWDLMTNWDWAAVSLFCMANEFEPRGNTQYGRHHSRKWETGVRTAGGAPGDSDVSVGRTLTGSGPSAWSHDGTPSGIHDLVGNVWEWVDGLILQDNSFLIAPDNGDYTNLQYEHTSYDASAAGTFSTRSYANAPEILKRALCCPVAGSAPTGHFYVNAEGERLPIRGGTWIHGSGAGLGALNLRDSRTNSRISIGFRPRFRNL